MDANLGRALGQALGSEVRQERALAGGDINDAYAVTLADGRQVFVKTNRAADPRMFDAEARGLAWLAEPGVIRVPRVLAVSAPEALGPHFLVLELIQPGRPSRAYDETLGRRLAALHQGGADSVGLPHDNFIGTLPQANQPCCTWSEFYGQRRLMPQVLRAVERGLAPPAWLAWFERLCERLSELTGPPEPPARLHGDLWSGNLHTDEAGQPCLIDPAVYGGHREVDLAMLTLFGNPGARLFAAYDEVYPRAPGHEERVALYQLYPLLVHVNLFGGSYVRSVEHAVERYL